MRRRGLEPCLRRWVDLAIVNRCIHGSGVHIRTVSSIIRTAPRSPILSTELAAGGQTIGEAKDAGVIASAIWKDGLIAHVLRLFGGAHDPSLSRPSSTGSHCRSS